MIMVLFDHLRVSHSGRETTEDEDLWTRWTSTRGWWLVPVAVPTIYHHGSDPGVASGSDWQVRVTDLAPRTRWDATCIQAFGVGFKFDARDPLRKTISAYRSLESKIGALAVLSFEGPASRPDGSGGERARDLGQAVVVFGLADGPVDSDPDWDMWCHLGAYDGAADLTEKFLDCGPEVYRPYHSQASLDLGRGVVLRARTHLMTVSGRRYTAVRVWLESAEGRTVKEITAGGLAGGQEESV